MKNIKLAYFAGFFDGEGCIRIATRKAKPYNLYRLDVGVGSTNLWILQSLRFAFGGSVNLQPHTELTRQPFYAWRIFDRKAYQFLIAIIPFLHLKRAQAELAIEFQQTRSKRHWHRTEEERAVELAQQILMGSLKRSN